MVWIVDIHILSQVIVHGNAMLKMTKIELDLISDQDMYLFLMDSN